MDDDEHKGMGGLSFDYEINAHVLMDCDEMLCEIPESEREDDDRHKDDAV